MINIMPESQNQHDDEKAEESPGFTFLSPQITENTPCVCTKMSLLRVFRMLLISKNTNKKYNN